MKAVTKLSDMRLSYRAGGVASTPEKVTYACRRGPAVTGSGSGVDMAADGVMIGLDRVPVFPLYQGPMWICPRCPWGGVAQLVRAAES